MVFKRINRGLVLKKGRRVNCFFFFMGIVLIVKIRGNTVK